MPSSLLVSAPRSSSLLLVLGRPGHRWRGLGVLGVRWSSAWDSSSLGWGFRTPVSSASGRPQRGVVLGIVGVGSSSKSAWGWSSLAVLALRRPWFGAGALGRPRRGVILVVSVGLVVLGAVGVGPSLAWGHPWRRFILDVGFVILRRPQRRVVLSVGSSLMSAWSWSSLAPGSSRRVDVLGPRL